MIMEQKTMKKLGFCLMICLFMIVKCIENQTEGTRHKDNIEKYLAGYYDNIDTKGPVQEATYLPPSTWNTYRIAGSFSISIPNTLEMRKEADPYTQRIKDADWYGYKVDLSNVVFQQKGLADYESEALDTYCRVMLNVETGNRGDYMKSNEWAELTDEDIQVFQESLQYSSDISKGEFKIIGKPNVGWIHIEDIYGIEIRYLRTGIEGNRTVVNTYYFFNDAELATLTLSYRQTDAEKWEKDLENIVRTFEWLE